MLKQILPTLAKSFIALWDNILTLVLANLLWAVSFFPTLIFLNAPIPWPFNLIGTLLVIVFCSGPATLGLFNMTVNVTSLERIELGEFFNGIKTYYWRGVLLAIINMIFVLIVVVNVSFYSQGGPLATVIPIVGVWFSFFWFILQVYLWPLAVRMEDGRLQLRLLFRNATLAAFKYLGFSFIISLFLAIILLLSYLALFLPTVILGMTLHTLVCNNALRAVLVQEGVVSEPDDNEAESL